MKNLIAKMDALAAAKQTKTTKTLTESAGPGIDTVYPDTKQGVLQYMQYGYNKSFLKQLDLPTCKIHPDPEVRGVWAVDSMASGYRCIIYLAGYKDPMGNIRNRNDNEEGGMPKKMMMQMARSGDLTPKLIQHWVKCGSIYDDEPAKLVKEYNEWNDVNESIDEAAPQLNHMGEREYETWHGWKAACRKAYPGCGFRGDRDIGAATLGGCDVGEWDGAVGSVYQNAGPDVVDETENNDDQDTQTDAWGEKTTRAERDEEDRKWQEKQDRDADRRGGYSKGLEEEQQVTELSPDTHAAYQAKARDSMRQGDNKTKTKRTVGMFRSMTNPKNIQNVDTRSASMLKPGGFQTSVNDYAGPERRKTQREDVSADEKKYDSDSAKAWENTYAKEQSGLGRIATRVAARLVGTKLDKTGKAKQANEGKNMKKLTFIIEGVKFRVHDPKVAKILRRFPHEATNFQAGGDLDDNLFDALYDHYSTNGEMPYGTMKARDGDPYNWISDKLDRELSESSMTEGFDEDSHPDAEVQEIFDKYPHEAKKFKETGELDDNSPMYDELYDHFSTNGEMPYGTAKARTGDPVQWIHDRISEGATGDIMPMESGPEDEWDEDPYDPDDPAPMVDEEMTPAMAARAASLKAKDAEWAKVKSSVDAGQKGFRNPFANDEKSRHSESPWRQQHGATGIGEADDSADEYECVYCGASADNADDPSAFRCCGEVGHVQKREPELAEDSFDPTLGNEDDVLVENDHERIVQMLTEIGLDEGLDFFFDGEQLVVIGRSTARVVINTVGGHIQSIDGEEVRIGANPKERPVANRDDVNTLVQEPEMHESIGAPGPAGFTEYCDSCERTTHFTDSGTCLDCGEKYNSEEPEMPRRSAGLVKEEVDADDIELLNMQYKSGQLTYDQFREKLDGLEQTDYSMRQGEMGNPDRREGMAGSFNDVGSYNTSDDEANEFDDYDTEFDESQFANSVDEPQQPSVHTSTTAMINQGNDLNRPKRQDYPLRNRGDNPMAEARSLMRQYNAMKNEVKAK